MVGPVFIVSEIIRPKQEYTDTYVLHIYRRDLNSAI